MKLTLIKIWMIDDVIVALLFQCDILNRSCLNASCSRKLTSAKNCPSPMLWMGLELTFVSVERYRKAMIIT